MKRISLSRPACAGVLLLAAAPLLGGCSDLSRTFGFAHNSPDEFSVTTQAPLAMPPSDALVPPQPGAPRPQAVSASQGAREALVPATTLGGPAGATMSPGQQALVQQAGPPAPAGIRSEVDQTAAAREQGDFAQRLLFWQKPAVGGDVVNAPAEAQRLRENAALGKSPVTGPTPVIKPRQRGWLEGIL